MAGLKYYSVGEVFMFDKAKLYVKHAQDIYPICRGCYFSDNYRDKHKLKRYNCCNHQLACGRHQRPDNLNVVFIEIKNQICK